MPLSRLSTVDRTEDDDIMIICGWSLAVIDC